MGRITSSEDQTEKVYIGSTEGTLKKKKKKKKRKDFPSTPSLSTKHSQTG